MKRKSFKFLFITADKYPPFRVDIKVLFRQEMETLGHKIDWLMQASDSKYQGDGRYGNGSVYMGRTDNGSGVLSKIMKHFYAFANDFRVFKLLANSDYDFVQVKDKFFLAIMPLIAAKMYRKKVFYWISFPFPEMLIMRAKEGNTQFPIISYIRGKATQKLLYSVVMKYADHVFVQSDKMLEDIEEQGISSSKMTVVPMGVSVAEAEKYLLDSEAPDVEVKSPSIIYLGTLTKDRHLEFLIDVLVEVKKQVPDAMLYFVGSGENSSDEVGLYEHAKKNGVSEDMVITGFLPIEEAWGYVKRADVCVSPFYPTPILMSTSPTKLIEYMVFNRPVVANNHPDQSKVLSESGAGICVPYDVESFSSAIVKLLNNPGLLESLAKNGNAYVKLHRDYKIIASMLEDKYYSLLSTMSDRPLLEQ